MKRALLALLICCASAPTALAAPPPRLSLDTSRVPVKDPYGGGVFGQWGVDHRGLPAYRYDIDHRSAPQARQPELTGRNGAWHQLGNDHVVALAHNRGYTELWSQDRQYQYVNLADPSRNQHAGGFGYVRVDGKTYTTLYEDLPPGTAALRRFGTGYYERITPAGPLRVRERTYAPYGNDPILLHDVVLRNTTRRTVTASWFEYWGVNPVTRLLGVGTNRGLGAPRIENGVLSVGQNDLEDGDPLSIYAASLKGPVDGFETRADAFFGAGGRADPDAVKAEKLTDGIAPAVSYGGASGTLFAFRAPVRIKPGRRVVLRYAYGAAQPESIPGLVAKYRAAKDPFLSSTRRWRRWLPQARLGGRRWLSRELQWDAYMLRSGTTYEESCGHHIISQGGYYQYSFGFQGAYRDPLQHMLPMIYMEPWIAREVIAYSAAQQPQSGFIPYAQLGFCKRFDFGSSNDLDLWLLLSAAEYGLATRDLDLFDRQERFADGGSATLWDHLKLAVRHQESQRGINGGYIMGLTGDWSDFATQLGPMTESILVTAQAAYVYPRLAELAAARGDTAFADDLRALGAARRADLERQWTAGGWYRRGYAAVVPIGDGAIFGEPQPWALLARVPDAEKAARLMSNIRRFLTGVDAPPVVNGPAKIGSATSPARNDPDVTERGPGGGVGSNNAVYVGGVWYAVNGWLVWALAEAQDLVPRAGELAWDEYLRNTLAAHSSSFPEHWNGTISADDACRAHHDPAPAQCGVGLSTNFSGMIMHQPAWGLFGAIRQAGVIPTERGYRIDPSLPFRNFRLSLPGVGVARKRGLTRGYLRTEDSGPLEMRVRIPSKRRVRVWAGKRRIAAQRDGDVVVFTLLARAGRRMDWAVSYRG